MKAVHDVVACVVDYGTFESLAVKLSESFSKVFYYTSYETEYRDICRCVVGEGVPGITRLDEFMDPAIFNTIDLFIFPDIGYAKLQRYLESVGKAVWGSREATQMELDRALFLDVLKDAGLPVPKSKVVKGLASLVELLKREADKWVKLNIYRANMETWHHIDYEHSLPMLRYLETTFGGRSEDVVFVVQDVIPDAQENGYDGFCVNGKFPKRSFQGYEKKNELYLGTWVDIKDMPENVQRVNEGMAPILKKIGYRNFFATEIRDEYFIDPTVRMAGQSQEQLLESCSNLAEIVWHGANGVLIEPKFTAKFAASATLHYNEVPCEESWKVLKVPLKDRRWFKFYSYCQDGDTFHFPPGKNDEVGVVLGNGDSVEAAINSLKKHLEALDGEPVCAHVEGFADILSDIAKAQAEHGIKFTSHIPAPAIALQK